MCIREHIFLLSEGFKRNILLLIILLYAFAGISEAAQVWPPPPQKARIEYLYSFKKPEDLKIARKTSERFFEFLFGKGKNEVDALVRPQGIYSRAGVIFVTDTVLGSVHVFNEKQGQYFKIKKVGKESLLSPVGVAVGESGKIYVSDSRLNKVFIFNSKGDFAGELGKGRFLRPCGIAVDNSSGRIYVVDTLGSLVNVFDSRGDFLFNFGTKGEKGGGFNHPTYISVDEDGNSYVVDSLNFRVQIFGRDGKFKSFFGKMGRAPGAFSLPKGIALDSDQNIYVTDSSFDNVQIFNREGDLLLFFGESGNQTGEFWLPGGLAIDEEDKIFVADSYNGRVQVFRYLK